MALTLHRRSLIHAGAIALTFAMVAGVIDSGFIASAAAQNNVSPYAPGTNCKNFTGDQRSACGDSFSPYTSPREWQQRQTPGAILPQQPRGLGQAPATLAPKDPHQPILVPTPTLPRFTPPPV